MKNTNDEIYKKRCRAHSPKWTGAFDQMIKWTGAFNIHHIFFESKGTFVTLEIH